MGIEDALDMNQVKQKLTNLRDYMPNQHESVYEFGRLLSERLNPTLVPIGFNLTAEQLVEDLRKGVDSYSGKPIRGKLAGMPKQLYAIWGMFIDQIAEAVCPEDFAQGVKEIRKEIREEIARDINSQR